jgi:hypothetical protein
MVIRQSNASLCLGLPFGGLKQEMQQSRTSKTDPHSPGMCVCACYKMWTRSIKLLILKR